MERKARTRESTVNGYLAVALSSKHPRWTVEAESTRVFADNAAKAPDIVVRMPGGMSVILESEYAPATTVEADAAARLGEHLAETGEPIEQVVALRIPETLSHTPQTELSAAISKEQFDYCLLSGIDLDSPARFPSAGWITGDINALANLVESISVSERQLSIAVGVLENGVSEAAGNLRERLSDDRHGVLGAIAGGTGDGSLDGVLRLGEERLGVIGMGQLDDGGYGQLRELELARTCLGLLDNQLRLPRHRALPLPIARMGNLGRGGPGNAAIGVKPLSPGPIDRGTGAYAAPFRIHDLGAGTERWRAASYPALWAHDSSSGRESRMEVAPDSYGELRPGCGDKEGQKVWRRSASRVHINLDFRLNSQRLGACLTLKDCIGGRAWPSFFVEAYVYELPIVLWLNTTLGLLGRWWVGSRQQEGRSLLSVGRIAEIPVLDCRKLSGEILTDASEVFTRFRLREFLPANEAYRDEVRQELDRAVLCDLLGLPESVLDSLETLREQWCREPTVHGGKLTRPDA